MENKPVDNYTRSCSGCTECCRGWKAGVAHGKVFYPGRPCHFATENSCAIYENRPKKPCVEFKCLWLTNTVLFPEWMKPSLSKVLLTRQETPDNKIQYISVTECGQKIDSSVLIYLVLMANRHKINIGFEVDGGMNYVGSDEFLKDVTLKASGVFKLEGKSNYYLTPGKLESDFLER